MILRALALTSAALMPSLLHAQEEAKFSAADIETASYSGGDLPTGRTALTAKVQILMDRSGTSPGVVDGFKGGMSTSAMKAFERRAGLPMDGVLDPQVWDMLQLYAAQPLTQDYTITEEDAQGLVDAIPTDYAEKAAMTTMAYTSVVEKLAERFHMDEKFIGYLNPGVALVPGATIKVTTPAKPVRGKVSVIYVDKATRRVAAYDADGRMLADYPATVGSDQTPSPSGVVTVDAVALDPTYTYDPSKNFKQGENDKVLIVPPGPNGPVGNVWIDLSKPTYGIHGTPTPSSLFRNQSYGCVRLTNWDARELAGMVQTGVTRVEFLQPGVSIADATGVTSTPAAVDATDPAAAATTGVAAVATDPAATTDAAAPVATDALAYPDGAATGDLPTSAAGADPATALPAGKSLENTNEDLADQAVTSDPNYVPADPLSQALDNVLGQGAAEPPAAAAPDSGQ